MVLSRFLISIFKANSLASKSFSLEKTSIQILKLIWLYLYTYNNWVWKKKCCKSLITWHPFPVILFLCLVVNCSNQLFAVCSTGKTSLFWKEAFFYKTFFNNINIEKHNKVVDQFTYYICMHAHILIIPLIMGYLPSPPMEFCNLLLELEEFLFQSLTVSTSPTETQHKSYKYIYCHI